MMKDESCEKKTMGRARNEIEEKGNRDDWNYWVITHNQTQDS